MTDKNPNDTIGQWIAGLSFIFGVGAWIHSGSFGLGMMTLAGALFVLSALTVVVIRS